MQVSEAHVKTVTTLCDQWAVVATCVSEYAPSRSPHKHRLPYTINQLLTTSYSLLILRVTRILNLKTRVRFPVALPGSNRARGRRFSSGYAANDPPATTAKTWDMRNTTPAQASFDRTNKEKCLCHLWFGRLRLYLSCRALRH